MQLPQRVEEIAHWPLTYSEPTRHAFGWHQDVACGCSYNSYKTSAIGNRIFCVIVGPPNPIACVCIPHCSPDLKAVFPVHSVSPVLRRLLPICALLFWGGGIAAQDAVPSDLASPNESGLSPREIGILRSQNSDSASTVDGGTLAETPRRLHYSVSATVRGVYDDNVNISSFNRESDFYFAIEPFLSMGFGGQDVQGANRLTFVYRPSIFLFADHSERNTVQHLVHLQGQHRFARLAVSLSQNVQILDGTDLNSLSDTTGHTANIDVGQAARHNIFTTQLGDSYDLTGKLFLTNSVCLPGR